MQSQDGGIARASSRPKTSSLAPDPIHPSMRSRTNTTTGAPPNGAPPDASSPKVTDPTRQGKVFAVPGITRGMTSDPECGFYDPSNARAVMDQAKRAPDDFAKDLHAVLPAQVKEE